MVLSGDGGLASRWGTMELVHNSVAGNLARDDDDPLRAKFGGAMVLDRVTLDILNSTISNNFAESRSSG